MGISITLCGAVPTPALALAASARNSAAIMVTGSHIPADRNGLKFYSVAGEITKQDEAMILDALGQQRATGISGSLRYDDTVQDLYAARYHRAFTGALQGQHIGIYQHSAVGRDALGHLLESLGARVTVLGRATDFIPIDTEAVSDRLRQQLRDWAKGAQIDAIVSTDADGDRPLLADHNGTVVPGDILGQITAQAMRADTVVTPVSSNTSAERMGIFDRVIRTKIGSPHVIAAMATAGGKVAGYEANGGFLLGFDARGPSGDVARLMTRDAILPILATLAAATRVPVAEVAAQHMLRITATDRLRGIDPCLAKAFLQSLQEDPVEIQKFLGAQQSDVARIDQTDGLRMTMQSGQTVHLRLSGNAPEMRIYVEADEDAQAKQSLRDVLCGLAGHAQLLI
jgi:phosphomannomutase